MTEDLSRRPCICPGEMVEIIGFSEPDEYRPETYPIRKGWFCFDCNHWESAILRERVVDISKWVKR